ncbi:hypothetical protein C900_02410 [Fulvivirga imtechensis AK7]|uniref:STAS/SEC14 domain-containing protein n=2 Tax=Fulvivirga TaxID=396811 RepID=L8JVN2_9BACT|nr:hypothetical protein C900_02410 [Fulvivirga imtechensis AK7]
MLWEGYVSSIDFREGTEMMLNLLIENRTSKVLANIKDMLLIDKEDQQWLQNYFLPRAMRFGFRTLAIVKPTSYFNLAAIEEISTGIREKEFKIELFDSVKDAQNWLSRELI